ncbi:NUDIX domain-containing protein [Chitinophaga horti]|uniref:NUDIX domain-containing protein n=1 Tax=Chitinophaga horti TaxID=2920382 RepID=A0ABY6J4B4_9BACT|nr:NUDIX domain-containing protein [Chitinophaga horti]UYQ94515.1 NUDIX domain-containing protein [Chitinophaga horti]
MPKRAAGILLFRKKKNALQFFLVHPGGPYWKNKDEGVWTIPKGEYETDEDPLHAALREFQEETGIALEGDFIPLEPVRQKSGKIVQAWAMEGDLDTSKLISNTFLLEWPPKSGMFVEVPEVDRGEWFGEKEARQKINQGQIGLIDQLTTIL